MCKSTFFPSVSVCTIPEVHRCVNSARPPVVQHDGCGPKFQIEDVLRPRGAIAAALGAAWPMPLIHSTALELGGTIDPLDEG
jgi:hypothetical protein